MKFREFLFEDKLIRGFLHEGKREELIIIAHGFSGNKADHHFMFATYAKELAKLGYDVLRFDFLGGGDSDGLFIEDIRIQKQIDQLHKIIDEMKPNYKHIHLFGFSLGGVIASKTAAERDDISSLFLLSPAGNFSKIIAMMLKDANDYGDFYDYNGFKVHKDLITEANTFPYYEGLKAYKRNVMIVQGSNDQYVSTQSLQAYQNIFQHSKTHVVEGADHCYTSVAYSDEVICKLKEFFGGTKDES